MTYPAFDLNWGLTNRHAETQAHNARILARQMQIASSPIATEAYKGKVIEHEPSANDASRRD